MAYDVVVALASKPSKNDSTLTLALPKSRVDAAALVVAPGTPEERRIELGAAPVVLGSAADISVNDPHVSRRHAQVTRVEDTVVIRDLDSRNGTYVDGIAVKEAILHDRAAIRIGATTIRFETNAEARATGPKRMGDAIGSSAEMQQVFEMLERLAPSDLTVTLTGETGVGKDVLARAVHAASARSAAPFVVFDCGAATPTLIESALFGHEKGAFTGAMATVAGAFERADGGTLFFDEIGELSLDLQPKLLRALEQRKIQRIGSPAEIPVNVRILAATNRDLEREVAEGRFRQDLFFRLSAAVVSVPPLRARLADLPELVDAILVAEGRRLQVTQDTLDALTSYDWPGNVRELRNVLSAAAAMADADLLEPRHLLFFKQKRRESPLDDAPLAGRTLESIERAAIVQTLKGTAGNKTKTAKALGIAASTLYEKMRRYGIA